MALFAEGNRSKFESTAYTVLLLAFFFAVGLAGGVLYRLLPGSSGTQVASQEKPTLGPTPAQATPSAAPKATAAAAEPAPAAAAPLAAARLAAAAKPASAPTKATPLVAAVNPASAPTSALPSIASPAALPTQPPGATDAIAAVSEPIPVPAATASASGQTVSSLPTPLPPSPTATPATDVPGLPPGAAAKSAVAKPAAPIPTKAKAAPPEKRLALATAPRPVAVAPTDAGTGHVRVQFGAFAVEENAHQIQAAVEATGLGTELSQVTTPKGRVIYFVRSHLFPDRAAALAAATAAQSKAKNLADPVAIDFFIVGDTSASGQQAQAASH